MTDQDRGHSSLLKTARHVYNNSEMQGKVSALIYSLPRLQLSSVPSFVLSTNAPLVCVMGAEQREQVTMTVLPLPGSPTNYSQSGAANAGSEPSEDVGSRIYTVSYCTCPW